MNAAKAKGKDAQHCYDTNYCGIMQHRDTANKAAIKCQESAENSIKNSLGFIDNLVSVNIHYYYYYYYILLVVSLTQFIRIINVD